MAGMLQHLRTWWARINSMSKRFMNTARRLSSANVETKTEVAGNRMASAVNTVALGGTIAAIVTYYYPPPEELHSHVDALLIYGWNSLVFFVGHLWSKYGG
jgi:hypothetical protein